MICGLLYRVTMRLAHRFNWHYAPPVHPEGDTVLWCKWCGLRQKTASAPVNSIHVHAMDSAAFNDALGRCSTGALVTSLRKELGSAYIKRASNEPLRS
jgi:hypothetical protein